MRALPILILLVGACGKSAPVTHSPESVQKPGQESVAAAEPALGQVRHASFASQALGVDKSYYIYLPADYQETEIRYPVIYMLHGLGGQENNWALHMELPKAADQMSLSAIVVMPDGDDSFYSNSVTPADYDACMKTPRRFGRAAKLETYCVKKANHEDYIVDDLVAHIDQSYRTISESRARAIGGLSMGGYGALMLAMRHKDVFSSVASHSGVAALLYEGPYPFAPGLGRSAQEPAQIVGRLGAIGGLLENIFGTEIEHWRAHDPSQLARTLSDGELSIYIDCGTEDDFHLQHGASYLHEILEGRGVSHFFELLPGRHDRAFWVSRIDDSLRFHSEHFASP